jgi:hypothetical protein
MSQDCQAIILSYSPEFSRPTDHVRGMDLFADSQSELIPHAFAEIIDPADTISPAKFVHHKSRQDKELGWRIQDTAIPALIDVHEIHSSASSKNANSIPHMFIDEPISFKYLFQRLYDLSGFAVGRQA